jgi:hypothetical protein
MTLQELLEHAHLDALGQLDEREQAAFEAAFTVAPPAVKAQVRVEQSRWAAMDHLLPQVEPPAYLRDRVLDAVAAAMITQQASDMSLQPSRRVARAWRTASIGLLTAVAVLSTAFVYVYNTANANAQLGQNGLLADSTLAVLTGKMKDAVLSPNTARCFFVPQAGTAFEGLAAVWTHPSWDQDRLFVDLPKNIEGESYRLVVLNAAGDIEKELDSFTSNGILNSRIITKQPSGTRLALVTAGIGKAAQTGMIVMTATKA